jgi:hypothetical protein
VHQLHAAVSLFVLLCGLRNKRSVSKATPPPPTFLLLKQNLLLARCQRDKVDAGV